MDNSHAHAGQAESHDFDSIPAEMRSYRQWIVWRYENNGGKKPGKIPYCPTFDSKASVTSPATWGGYDDAISRIERGGMDGIGFVITKDDPYCFIDLDDAEGDEAIRRRQDAIYNAFDSYAETSPSGVGLHIIARGDVPHGRRRDCVEVYSSERYMTMTGRVYRNVPISDHGAKLNILWAEMAGSTVQFDPRPYFRQATETDEAVFDHAAKAANGPKFLALWNGDPTSIDGADKSGSAIDMALVDIIAFYTNDPSQVERLWLSSPHGQRAKTQDRPKYRRSTIERAFDRKPKPIDTSSLVDQLKGMIAAEDAGTSTPNPALPITIASEFEGRPIQPRWWIVDGMIPCRDVTLLGGDGGSGKSLLALQLAVAMASKTRWIDEAVRPGTCLFVSAEDESAELHRRLAAITRLAGIGFAALRDLALASLAGADALLAVPRDRSGALTPTAVAHALWEYTAAHRPALIVLDTLADLFGGEENDRAQVRAFVGMLRTLAMEFDVAILLLAHPSLTGMANGSGLSGSTAWNNSVRSRLYLARERDGDPNVRTLQTMKSNYGATGQQIRLEWKDGAFRNVGRTSNEPAHRVAAEHDADELFLRLLADFTAQGRTVSAHSSSRTHAALMFSQTEAGRNFKRQGFEAAMHRLFEAGRIRVQTVGYASKQKDIIVAVEASDPFRPSSERLPTASDPGADPAPTPFRPTSDPLPSDPPYPP